MESRAGGGESSDRAMGVRLMESRVGDGGSPDGSYGLRDVVPRRTEDRAGDGGSPDLAVMRRIWLASRVGDGEFPNRKICQFD